MSLVLGSWLSLRTDFKSALLTFHGPDLEDPCLDPGLSLEGQFLGPGLGFNAKSLVLTLAFEDTGLRPGLDLEGPGLGVCQTLPNFDKLSLIHI